MPEMLIGNQEARGATTPLLAHTLIEMFSLEPPRAHSDEAGAADRRALWTADALHRANNLAQMSSSLESARVRHLHGLHDGQASADARALSRAYAELGALGAGDRVVPCGPLLEVVVTKLVKLFGGDRSVCLEVSLDEVALSAEQRRALVLIASELVINALKYAFPPGRVGGIIVTLVRRPDEIELSVADDGVGLVSHSAVGSGKALMERLAALLSADIRHLGTKAGLKVVVAMPCPLA